MATFNFFDIGAYQLGRKLEDWRSGQDVLKIILTNTAPDASDTVKADLTEISAGNGYTAGGESIGNDWTQSTTTGLLTGTVVIWTASGGSIGPFQYVVLYDDTATGDPLIGWWDYGSPITLTAGQTFAAQPAAFLAKIQQA